uniref:PhyR sigma-like domain, NepR anti transduction, response regulator, sigma n=1 Tax=CrAss-like virus sp. ctYsL76 TaxID=2826826 RepID=A0A8S5QLI2_9CAUD|nr:MAG TPA: PhyR sigma-like domain, NepR anti transduction, response regulator, sigma [CrAss-like virus sp. ctYsL76]
MRKNNLNLEQIKQEATTLELQIINLYFQRISRKEISNKLSINTGKISTTVYKYGLTRFRSRNKYTINLNNLNVNNNQI